MCCRRLGFLRKSGSFGLGFRADSEQEALETRRPNTLSPETRPRALNAADLPAGEGRARSVSRWQARRGGKGEIFGLSRDRALLGVSECSARIYEVFGAYQRPEVCSS